MPLDTEDLDVLVRIAIALESIGTNVESLSIVTEKVLEEIRDEIGVLGDETGK